MTQHPVPRLAAALLAGALALTLSFGALAQQPGAPAQPTAEQMRQMQAAMQRQMQMMAVMFDVRPSRQGYEETVRALRSGASRRGWAVGEALDMHAQMQRAGMKDARRMTVIPVCPPQANERLARASGGKAPPLPCRATVFEGQDGKIYLVRMNTANMAKLVNDAATARVLNEIGTEEDELYRPLVQ